MYPPIPAMTWKELSKDTVQKRLQRSLSNVLVFSLHSASQGAALARFLQIEHHELQEGFDAQWIADRVPKKDQKLFFLGKESAIQSILPLLHKHPGMRDRLFAVLTLNPRLDPEWMKEHFTQEAMDVEMNSAIPYISLSFEEGCDRLVEPAIPATGWHSIRVIDVGTLEEPAPDELAFALAVLMGSLY